MRTVMTAVVVPLPVHVLAAFAFIQQEATRPAATPLASADSPHAQPEMRTTPVVSRN